VYETGFPAAQAQTGLLSNVYICGFFHENEADHAVVCVVTIKNAWIYKHIPSHVFLARCLIKHRTTLSFFYFVKYVPYQTSLEKYAWGKNNKA
jgi:hypothetical protein